MLAPDWAEKCFVLFCPIGEQHLLSSFCMFVHDGYCLAILVWHGNGQVIVGTLGLFCQWLKPFVAPFPAARLTAPESPRMSSKDVVSILRYLLFVYYKVNRVMFHVPADT